MMRNYMVVLLLLAHVFAYADRTVVSVLLPAFKKSLGLSLVEASIIQGMAFSLLFAVIGIPIGRMADRYNRLRLLACGLTFWSLATVACGLSTSFAQLIMARMAVAVGEACLIPAAASLLSDTFAPHYRARAISIVQTGAPIGSLIAVAGGGWLLTWFDTSGILVAWGFPLESWQAVFLTLGMPGLILAGMLLFTIKEPDRRAQSRTAEAGNGGVLALIRHHPVAFLGFFALQSMVSMETYALLGWTPTVLITEYGQTAAEAGWIMGALLVASGITAYLVGGIASDLLARRWPRHGRMLVPGIILPASTVALVWLYYTRSLDTTCMAVAVATFGGAMTFSSAIATLQAIVPARLHGQTVAVLYFCVNVLGAGIAPTLIAFVAGFTESLQQALSLVSAISLGAGLIIWAFTIRAYARVSNFELAEKHQPTTLMQA